MCLPSENAGSHSCASAPCPGPRRPGWRSAAWRTGPARDLLLLDLDVRELAMNSPTSDSSTLPSGPVSPFQKVSVTFWLGMVMSPAAAGFAAPWAAGAVVAAGARLARPAWPPQPASSRPASSRPAWPVRSWRRRAARSTATRLKQSPATTVVAARPNTRKNPRRFIPPALVAIALHPSPSRMSRTTPPYLSSGSD